MVRAKAHQVLEEVLLVHIARRAAVCREEGSCAEEEGSRGAGHEQLQMVDVSSCALFAANEAQSNPIQRGQHKPAVGPDEAVISEECEVGGMKRARDVPTQIGDFSTVVFFADGNIPRDEEVEKDEQRQSRCGEAQDCISATSRIILAA